MCGGCEETWASLWPERDLTIPTKVPLFTVACSQTRAPLPAHSCFPLPPPFTTHPCENLQGGIVFYRPIPLFSHVIPPVSLLLGFRIQRTEIYISTLLLLNCEDVGPRARFPSRSLAGRLPGFLA